MPFALAATKKINKNSSIAEEFNFEGQLIGLIDFDPTGSNTLGYAGKPNTSPFLDASIKSSSAASHSLILSYEIPRE